MTTSQRAGTWRIGRVVGVDVLIKPSLLVMGAVLVVLFAPRWENRSDTSPYLLATVFVVSLYLSVLIHEIAHVVAARAYRMRVDSVTLHLLGGETVIEGDSRTPGQELVTSIVGPLASLLIAAAAFVTSTSMELGTTADVIWSIAWVNFIVAGFNMLPGLPLDGGRVFRAIVWKLTGNEATGVRIAAWIGRLASVALVVFAAFSFSNARDATINLLIALFVAWFLWEGASDALHHAQRTARINLLVARDIGFPGATPPPGAETLSADLRGADLLRAMAARPAEAYALTEPDGSVYGVLTSRAVDDAYRSSRR
ncbi:site-2 protease family protein [Aeromicrobium wangtongii]|uniref:Site-2 protease family protein n=1 Tax=Aeromicrobium wangtongii TaxID=2969247 RepID=A0ABY5M1K2_9ACTN|nr:site-2 protease family protein [Aeromicrobium wangtongii]MCD9198041.1 site-2 protease family protein [Aeromicrobium wangtongii]UUP12083.1 site-2 protease family protein [Aeromicrobium wangtongii]